MIFVQSAVTIALLVVSSLGPGLIFVRYLRWRPLETLCAAVGLSLLLLYLAAFAIYLLELPPFWAYVPTGVAVATTLACAGDIRRLWRNRETRASIFAFFALLSWLILLLLLVRNYSGADWFGDWFEHYERALFFSEHKPPDTKFLSGLNNILPSRPPMMNLLTADIFWQVTPSFELFQIVFAYLNALVIFPCVLIAPSLIAKTQYRAWWIAGFLALSPTFVQNGTYTWSKLFAAFYGLTALGLYLSAWRKNDSPRMVFAFAFLATGMLVHYSTAPLILFLGGHYLIVLFWRRKHRLREIIAMIASSGAICATWLGWSLHIYGWKSTFASNTAALDLETLTFWGKLARMGQNIWYTLVPFFMRGLYDFDARIDPQAPPRGLAHVRDWFFYTYQCEFPTMLGFGGLIVVCWLLAKLCCDTPGRPHQNRWAFWLSFILVVTLAGIAVCPDANYYGTGHICLQPIVLLGVTLAAVGLSQVPRSVRGVALSLLLIDAVLGIVIHIHLLENVFDLARDGEQLHINSHAEMGISAIKNGVLKADNNLTFLGDHAVNFAGFVETIMNFGVLGICLGLWFCANRGVAKCKNL